MPNPVLDHMEQVARDLRMKRWRPEPEKKAEPTKPEPKEPEVDPAETDELLAYYQTMK